MNTCYVDKGKGEAFVMAARGLGSFLQLALFSYILISVSMVFEPVMDDIKATAASRSLPFTFPGFSWYSIIAELYGSLDS